MKIYINKYRSHWLSPFTIMTTVLFYKKWTDPEFDLYDDANDKYTDWLVKPCEYLQKLLNVVHPKIDYVKIDRWDTWSMDHTLAHIILPMLKQLQKDKHGAPFVDDADVPEELKSTSAPPKENEWDTDANHFKRWDWVLDEMIQAFECKVTDNWEERYSTGVSDFKFVKEQHSTHGTVSRMVDGPNHTRKTDWDAMALHQARNTNGYRLFGKYFEGLWD
jgi:hypothetical protein